MVYYFTLACDPSVICYMGRDKHENEELIRWGWPEDLWFHVDKLSSAHVYVRLPRGFDFDTITPDMVEECSQLVKANSIMGCKQNDVRVVYTPWANLKKTGDMDVGQVAYHDQKLQKFHTIHKKNTAMLNALEKTKITKEDHEVNFCEMRMERNQRVAKEDREIARLKAEEEVKERERRQKAHDEKHYVTMNEDYMMTDNSNAPDEDDFM